MTHINLAVLGGGRMAHEHCRQIEGTPGLELKAVSSRSREACRKTADLFPGVKVYEGHDELLADPNIQWVVITTYTNEHKDWALRALEAGKHLIIEKPITLEASDARDIFEAARRRDRLVTVHQNRRWDRDFELVKDVLTDGVLGDVYRIESRVCYSSEEWAGWGAQGMKLPWRLEKKYGGGILSDWGSHLFDQMITTVKGDVSGVYGHLESRIWSEEVEDHFYADLRFEDGRSVWVEASNNHRLPLPRWVLIGTEGMLTVSGGIPEQWVTATLRKPYRSFGRDEIIDISQDEFSPGFYNDFYEKVSRGEVPAVQPAEVLEVSRIIDAVRESSKTNRVVKI